MLFRNATFSGANVVMMVITLATFGVLLYTSLYLQEVLHFSPVRAGATLLPWLLIVIVSHALAGGATAGHEGANFGAEALSHA